MFSLGESQGGVQNVSRDFGGGGETYYRATPPKPLLEASESGIRLVCARSSKKMTGREHT